MPKFFHETSPRLFLSTSSSSSSRHTIRHFIQAMRRHDPDLIEHGKRTAIYSLLLAQALGLPNSNLSELCDAALLHDLGKLTLPNELVHQNGLSIIGDYLMTECSPRAGAEILRPWPQLQGIAKLIALHHEHWDGSGTPLGMRGTLIPLGARILSLTDTVDQLLTQKDIPIPDQINTVVRILRTLSGTRFDPKLVDVFVEEVAPSLKSLGLNFIFDCLWPTEHINSFSGPSISTPESSFAIHLKNIFELTHPMAYDSTPA